MDIYCTNCGEPWELDNGRYSTVIGGLGNWEPAYEKAKRGACPSCDGDPAKAGRSGSMQAMASKALVDILGDDNDGIAAMLEDYEYMGGFA